MALFISFIEYTWLNLFMTFLLLCSCSFFVVGDDFDFLGVASYVKRAMRQIKFYEEKISVLETLQKKEDYDFNIHFNLNKELRDECRGGKDRNDLLIRELNVIGEEKEFFENKKTGLVSKNESLKNDIRQHKEENLELIAKADEWEKRIKLIKTDISNLKNENQKLSEKVR